MASVSDQSSATSEENIINTKVKSMKEKDNLVHRSKIQDYDFLNPSKNMVLGSTSSSFAHNNSNNEDKNQKNSSNIFPCKFCKRKFSTPQSLGGHQNAHRKERAFAKHHKKIFNGTIETHRHPIPYYTHYPGYYTIPFDGFRFGSYNRALGINKGSMIQKPGANYSWTSSHFKSCFSSVWTPKQEEINFFPIEGLKNESLTVNNVTPALRNLLNLEENVGKSSIHIATKSNSKEKNSIVADTSGDNHHTNIQEASNSKSFELDLSLRL